MINNAEASIHAKQIYNLALENEWEQGHFMDALEICIVYICLKQEDPEKAFTHTLDNLIENWENALKNLRKIP